MCPVPHCGEVFASSEAKGAARTAGGRPGRPADPAAQTGNNDDAGIDGEGDDSAPLPGDGDGAPLPGDDDGATPLDDENDFADEGVPRSTTTWTTTRTQPRRKPSSPQSLKQLRLHSR